MPVSFQLLRAFPLLQTLPPEALPQLSAQMTLRSFARREMVQAKEQVHHEFGFLVDGRLQGVDFTVDGRSVGLYFIAPGDYFGELSVVDGLGASEHIIATTGSTVAFLEAKKARDLIFGTPHIARAVMVRLATRVRAATTQRTLLSLQSPFQRLCLQLLQLPLVHEGEKLALNPIPTHQEIAIMINASRETVTRAFQVLVLQKAVIRQGDALFLTRMEYLKDIAEGRVPPPKA